MHPILRTLAIWLLLTPQTLPAAESQWQFDDVDRVVAMADIHGAIGPMVRTLTNAGVLDDTRSWVGGSTHLVIVGDMLDRGPDSRDVMELLMRLEGQAAAAGGMVHVLIGNHEAMNLVGDLRYVSNAEYAAFADEETPAERNRWFEAYKSRVGEDTADESALRTRFDSDHPPGFFAHRRAFASDGRYGAWLLSKPVIVVINATAFVHGGLSPMIAEIGLDGVNRRLIAELAEYVEQLGALQDAGVLLPGDSFYEHRALLSAFTPGLDTAQETVASVQAIRALGDSDIHASNGPLWYRGNVYCGRLIEEQRLDAALDAIDADQVVIGHTPTLGRRVLQRLGGRVIELDTGMLKNYYNGLGHALIIENEILRVVSEESEESLSPEPHPRRVGERPGGFFSAAEIEQMLLTGNIDEQRDDASGRTIVTISDAEHRVDALFVKRPSRGFYPDVAAYRLDELLELGAVPVAVVREVDGTSGSLQFLPHQSRDESQRKATGLGGSAGCPLVDQWSAMYLFDVLIYNERRSLDRMLYSPDTWQLILTGHQDAFSARRGKPRYLEAAPLEINDVWLEALQSLNETLLEEQLGDVLDRRRRRALLARRDELIAPD